MKNNKFFDLVMVISITFLCIGLTPKVIQNDLFYTIKLGELVLENGIDMFDHFCWISKLSYTYPHWLYDVFTSVLYKLGGFNLLYFFTIFLYAIIGNLIYFFSKKRCKNQLLAGIVAYVAIEFLIPFITVRAQVISYIIFILEKEFLDRYLESGKKKYIIYLIILSTLMVNMHLGTWFFFFILFIPPIVSHYVTFFINKFRKKDESFMFGRIEFNTNKYVPKLFIIIGLVLLTGFLTPLGTTPFTYFIKSYMGNSFSYIREYQVANLANNFDLFFFGFVWIITLLFTKRKIRLEDLFFLLGLGLMSLISLRSFAYFIIIGFFIVSNYLKEINENFSKLTKRVFDILINNVKLSVMILVCFIVIGVLGFMLKNNNTVYYSEKNYPIEAVKFIKKELDVKEIRLFNTYQIGSYLLFNDIDVFIDSRAELYTKEFNRLKRDIFDDYMTVSNYLEYDEIFEYYDITHILINKDSKLYQILNKDINYSEIYSDNYFVLYERQYV